MARRDLVRALRWAQREYEASLPQQLAFFCLLTAKQKGKPLCYALLLLAWNAHKVRWVNSVTGVVDGRVFKKHKMLEAARLLEEAWGDAL